MNPTVAWGNRARAPSSIPRPARRTGTRHTGPEISSTSVSASGVRIWAGRVGMSRVASATMIRASSFMACLNSAVGVRSSRRTASLCRLSGPSTTWRFFASGFASLIQREGGGQGGDALAQAVELAAGGAGDDVGDLAHLVRAHAAGRHGGGAEPYAARYHRCLGIVRNHVLVAGDTDRFECLLELFACGVGLYQVDPTLDEPLGQRAAVLDYPAGVVPELGFERLAEGHRLACDRVHQGTALQPWEDAAVHLFGELLAAQDHAAACPAQRLVSCRGHDLAVWDRRRVDVGGDETCDVGHIGEQEGTDLVGDLPELVELYDARVGARAGQDHLRLFAHRDLAQLVVVYVAVVADAVVDYRVGAAGEVELHPVGEVAAVGQVHREDLVPRLQERRVGRLVGLAPRVRLHVGVLRAEDLLRPVYGELLDHVHELAAAVVTLARVALGVLVRHHRALGGEHRRGGEVLARYQLDGRPLAFELPVERLLNRGIYNLGIWP